MRILNWNNIDYEEATRRQLSLVEEVAGGAEEVLIFCTHPPVVTLGRGTKEGDVFSWQGPTLQTSRGGRATYHGPNQLIIYPVLDLNRPHAFAVRDIHAYIRFLEALIVVVLAELDIAAEARAVQPEDGGPSLTGVWVKSTNKKIASIGIAVKKWVTYHGVAINVDLDPQAFQGINPCGFQSQIMTSVEEVVGDNARQARQKIQQFFTTTFYQS